MSKLVKDLITNELRSRYAELESALWVEFVGVDGHLSNDFRRALRENGMRIEIVKNSLFRRAVENGPLSRLGKELDGPSAIIVGGDSLIDVAKFLDGEWMKKLDGLKLKGAILEGEWLDGERVQKLHKMESKADLLAKIATIVLSPGRNIAGAVNSGGANIAACVKAIAQKLEDGEEITRQSA